MPHQDVLSDALGNSSNDFIHLTHLIGSETAFRLSIVFIQNLV
jgi:hypothetical protein